MRVKLFRRMVLVFAALAFFLAFSACDTGVSGSGPNPGPAYYTVTFITSAGTTNKDDFSSRIVTRGGTVSRPSDPDDPEREEGGSFYDGFNNWYNGTDSDTPFDFSAPITANTTL